MSVTILQPRGDAATAEPIIAPRPVFKIMHVVNRMAMGGMEKGVLKVAVNLVEGLEHHICCIRDCDAEFVQRLLAREQITELKVPKSKLSPSLLRIASAIRNLQPHIVHSRNWGAIEAVIAARMMRVPIAVHSEHGYEMSSLENPSLRQRFARRLVLAMADRFFTVSRELRQFHARQARIGEEHIGVVYNGVDTQRFAPDQISRQLVRKMLGFSEHDFVIGAVGRMVPIKNYETLIQAVARVLKVRACRLLLVGDGPELSHLKELGQSLIGDQPSFTSVGRCDDVTKLLNSMDVFVQTSFSEGMSNTILEAMASGLPALVTRVGGNPEIIEEGFSGWMFSPGDVNQLSDLLFKLAGDEGLRKHAGRAARKHVQDLFSNQTMLENYRAMYFDLLQKRGLLPRAPLAVAKVHSILEGRL